jgi:type IV pilus assembly protein PilQ
MTTSTLILAAFLSAQLVSLDIAEMDLSDFIRYMGKTANMNVVLHPAVQGKVNLMVKDAPWEQVLDLVLKNHGLGKEVEGNTMRIARAASFAAPLQTRIYFLNYAKAEDMAMVISRMLSPSGSVIAYPSRNAVIVRDVVRSSESPR